MEPLQESYLDSHPSTKHRPNLGPREDVEDKTASFYSKANTIRKSGSSEHGCFRVACNFAKSLAIDAAVFDNGQSNFVVADYGCGSGGDLDKFRHTVGPERLLYWGCDPASGAIYESIERAKKKKIEQQTQFVIGSGGDPRIRPDKHVDLTWSAFALHYLKHDLNSWACKVSESSRIGLIIPYQPALCKKMLSEKNLNAVSKLFSIKPADDESFHVIRGRAWRNYPANIMFQIGGFTPELEPLLCMADLDVALMSVGFHQTVLVRLDKLVKRAFELKKETERYYTMAKRFGVGPPGLSEYQALSLYAFVLYDKKIK